MKYTTFVALSLLSLQCLASDLSIAVQAIESEWASIYYTQPKNEQEAAYSTLLSKTEQLAAQNPRSSELIFWQAVVIATNAELQDGFSALRSIHKARKLLEQVINLAPDTANGSAYVTLGTLYYMSPKWPVAFGDDEKAEQMFKAALKINPNGIDANYFYGDFLLANNHPKEALKYFEIALSSPSRKAQIFADERLKEEAKLALASAKNRKINGLKNAFLSTLHFSNY